MVTFILCTLFYFWPTFAVRKGRRGSVFVLNLFLGWTLIGWVVTMYIAVRSNETAKA